MVFRHIQLRPLAGFISRINMFGRFWMYSGSILCNRQICLGVHWELEVFRVSRPGNKSHFTHSKIGLLICKKCLSNKPFIVTNINKPAFHFFDLFNTRALRSNLSLLSTSIPRSKFLFTDMSHRMISSGWLNPKPKLVAKRNVKGNYYKFQFSSL